MKSENVETTLGITPCKVLPMGVTEKQRQLFERHLLSIMPMFHKDVYDIVSWNCNHFSDHVVRFLLGISIPSYILELPNDVCKTFMGKLVLNFFKMLQGGAPPVGIDDPSHPCHILDGGPTTGGRVRRNSCPASPGFRGPVLQPDLAPVIQAPVSRTTGRGIYGSSNSKRRNRTSRRLPSRARRICDSQPKPVTATAAAAGANGGGAGSLILRIVCDPIENESTCIDFSPVHRKLYEQERERFNQGKDLRNVFDGASGALSSAPRLTPLHPFN